MARPHANLESVNGSDFPASADMTEPSQSSGAVSQAAIDASTFTVSVLDPSSGMTRVLSTSKNVAAKYRQDQNGLAIERLFQRRAQRVATLVPTDLDQKGTAETPWSDIVTQWSIKIGASRSAPTKQMRRP